MSWLQLNELKFPFCLLPDESVKTLIYGHHRTEIFFDVDQIIIMAK